MVHVYGCGYTVIAQCFTDHRPNSQIGHIVIIHHIKMNDIGTRFEYRVNLFAETGKIGGQNGWSNQKISHKTPAVN